MTFDDAFARAYPFTLVTKSRCAVLWHEAQHAPSGDYAEVGVYQGGSAMILRAAAPDRTLHLIDTFAGHPAAAVSDRDPEDHPAGRYNDTCLSMVGKLVGEPVVFYVGALVGGFELPLPPLALVHIDVDLYESTKAALNAFCPRLVLGGVAICDDYADIPAARDAVDEFVAQGGWKLRVAETGQALLRRNAW